MTKKPFFRLARIMLTAFAVFLALCCAGCSSSSPKVDGYTGGYNTKENLALFRESDLYALAEGWRDAAASHHAFGRAVEATEATFKWHWPEPTTPDSPFLAVAVRRSHDADTDADNLEWQILGGTAKQLDLSGVKTLAVCVISTRSETYRELGGSNARTFSVSIEDADILYIDVASRDIVGLSEKKGNSLPASFNSSVSYNTLSADDLVSQIRADLSVPFTLSEDGEITGGKLSDGLDKYRFPSAVKKITKLEIGKNIETVFIPATVEEIAADAFSPYKVKLIVLPDTYGESFAHENGCIYRYQEDSTDSNAPWRIYVAGCNCTVERATLPSVLQPDGQFADEMQSRILVLEEGSAAEAYAREHQYLYRRSGEKEARFCIDGYDWIVGNYTSWYRAADRPDKMYLVSPDNKRWHLKNDRILEDVQVLRIRGDITDESELDHILYRAGQDLPFMLEVERDTGIAAFAKEHGIPFVFWE